jgi:hypothetical protein
MILNPPVLVFLIPFDSSNKHCHVVDRILGVNQSNDWIEKVISIIYLICQRYSKDQISFDHEIFGVKHLE